MSIEAFLRLRELVPPVPRWSVMYPPEEEDQVQIAKQEEAYMATIATEHKIFCANGHQERLLLRVVRRGILAWCKTCRRSQVVPREMLESLWRELDTLSEHGGGSEIVSQNESVVEIASHVHSSGEVLS